MGKDKKDTKPKFTRDYHSGDRNKREKDIPSKLQCGELGINILAKL